MRIPHFSVLNVYDACFRLGNVMSTQQMKTGDKSASLEQSLKIKGELCSLCLNTFPCLSSLGHCLNPKSTVHCDFFLTVVGTTEFHSG